MTKTEQCVVCLGVPAFHDESHLERLRAIAGVRPEILPIDPGGDWLTVSPAEPFVEPPPWARGVLAEREACYERAHVLVSLHTPDRLPERAPHLRWAQGIGAGVEQFGKAGLSPSGSVILTNAAGVSSGSMAEWVIARLLQIWKRLRETDLYQTRHEFERTYGRTFAGSTIGIVGLGNIGVAVAVRARALGCRVLGLKRSARPGDRSEHVDALFGPPELDAMLGQCDAVVVAAPDTPETHKLIDAKALAAMRSDAVLVNVARGALLDEAALADAMRAEKLGAAVLDVFDPEPLDPESPLWDLPGVYISAHSSVSVDRYMEDVFDLFVDNLERFVEGKPLRNVVDMESLGFS